jgi:hypothetical protein
MAGRVGALRRPDAAARRPYLLKMRDDFNFHIGALGQRGDLDG